MHGLEGLDYRMAEYESLINRSESIAKLNSSSDCSTYYKSDNDFMKT